MALDKVMKCLVLLFLAFNIIEAELTITSVSCEGLDNVTCVCPRPRRKTINITVTTGHRFLKNPNTQKYRCGEQRERDLMCGVWGCYYMDLYPKEVVLREKISNDSQCEAKLMSTAISTCFSWKNFMDMCDATCIDGYAYEKDGKSVKSKRFGCYPHENYWHPSDFEECKPYDKCGVDLISAGHLRCERYLKTPKCDIACYDFKRQRMSQFKTYTCYDSPDGKYFEPPLPECAGAEDLIEAPAVKTFATGLPIFTGKQD